MVECAPEPKKVGRHSTEYFKCGAALWRLRPISVLARLPTSTRANFPLLENILPIRMALHLALEERAKGDDLPAALAGVLYRM